VGLLLSSPDVASLNSGGDVNITDDDGDTPLYTVENIETARFLVDHGALVARQNMEGISVNTRPYEPFHSTL
jgi:ankyrin repeat protein